MRLFPDDQRIFAERIAELNFTNPFLPERIRLEQSILGRQYRSIGNVWSRGNAHGNYDANIERINQIAAQLLDGARKNLERFLAENDPVDKDDITLYEEVVVYTLFNRYLPDFYQVIRPEPEKPGGNFQFYRKFLSDHNYYLGFAKMAVARRYEPSRLFAIYYQVHRAFYHTFEFIVGGSLPTARLRAAIWQSVFTHDLKRYYRSLFNRMSDLTTLITGPSGTGKELVARAISFSGYVPFDPKTMTFSHDFRDLFFPLHLSAMSQNLIESELFGHRKGAYTGALSDRIGWLEQCPGCGTVFLDEVGEINQEIQVKLLRVLQTRTFQRLGDQGYRNFPGKVITATHRNLEEELRKGSFRADFYYRICSDRITTPSLREQLDDFPDDLENLVLFLSGRLVGPEEAVDLTTQALGWIDKNLTKDYSWSGNVRELDQCVRNILIRGSYSPARFTVGSGDPSLTERIEAGQLTADQMLSLYCKQIYRQTGNYTEAAQRLNLDRRTAKKYIDMEY